MNLWAEDFGDDYTKRNKDRHPDPQFKTLLGMSRTEMNLRFICPYLPLPKRVRILEVGCNIGRQLAALESQGYENLWGVDINSRALRYASNAYPNIKFGKAEALCLPFPDNYFDLVFTSGLLIHIPPANLERVMNEIIRVSKSYIHGHEYYAKELIEVPYRGHPEMLWKADYPALYVRQGLRLLDEQHLHNMDGSGNIDCVFTLEKRRES